MIRRFWERLTDKRELSMRNRDDNELRWTLNISPLALWSSIVALITLIFVGLMLLMAYTSILDIFPDYRTRSERVHETMTANIIRLDSMEHQMRMMLEYNEAVTSVLNNSSPTLHSTVLTDTIRYDKSRVLPTRADSLLRAALESTIGEYSLTNTKTLKSEAAMFTTPLTGTITRSFDAPEMSYDIIIMSFDNDNSVVSVENGTVVSVDIHSDGNSAIMIQHAGGYLSVYKQLSEVFVRKGDAVQSGSVIGLLNDAKSDDAKQAPELGFELWRNGTPIDPELLIKF